MAIFRKNKRQFAYRSIRRVFVALFLLLAAGAVTFILNANAQLVPVESVEIFSEHSSFENNESGSWKITKSAEWTDYGKARITFEVESVAKIDDSKKLDVVMVIDNSGSMDGNKMYQVKADATDLVSTLLSDSSNRVALITFESSATILSGFTNNKTELLDLINGIPIAGSTNYYDGLLKADEVLQGYVPQNDRDLVLLFLTDGYPNMDTPNEVAQYQTLKTKYPFIIINGIQYEMGNAILPAIIAVSDNQFIANMDSLNNVLFEASLNPQTYEEFVIKDYIDDDYWTIAGLEAIEASLGEVGLEYDGSTPKVTWDMSGLYRSGGSAKLTIEISLKDAQMAEEGLLLPTNTHEEISTKIDETPDETIDSPNTPILKDIYDVIYEANTPSGCETPGSVPETSSHTVFSAVEVSDSMLSCHGYIFKGWRVATSDIMWINDSYFRMPGKDVYVVGVWASPSITKTMDGRVHVRASATFTTGESVNIKMKRLSGQSTASYYTVNNYITAFKRATTLSSVVDVNDSKYLLSTGQSDVPIYGWFDQGILYFYTEADDIYLGGNPSRMFYNLRDLEDIDSLVEIQTTGSRDLSMLFYGTGIKNIDALVSWDTSSATDIQSMFHGASSLENIDGAINWDTSKVITTSGMFNSASSLENIDGAINWNLSKVVTTFQMFYSAKSLTNIDGAEKWNLESNKNMGGMFAFTDALSDLSGAKRWNTGSVTNMASMFYYSKGITDLNGLEDWNTESVTDMSQMFYDASNLTDIDALSEWDLTSATILKSMFNRTGITDIDALSEWDLTNVTDVSFMFGGANKLKNVNGATEWNMSNITNISSIFSDATALEDISGLEKWDISNVKLMSQLFANDRKISDFSSIKDWDTSKATTMNGIFWGTKIADTSALEKWVTPNVTDMSQLFQNATSLVDISELADWDTSKVTNMFRMFYTTKVADLTPLAGFDTSNVTNMSQMFYGAGMENVDALATKTINGTARWDTSKVTNMSQMFYGVSRLTNINGISNWNTSSVTDMSRMFYYTGITNIDALATKTIDGTVRWDVSKVTDMSAMFASTHSLANIDGASGWNTSSVTDMSIMFTNAFDLANIDGAINWNTGNVTDMHGMFSAAYDLANIDGAINWNTGNVTNMTEMFMNASSLENIDGASGWNTGNVTSMYRMFNNATSLSDIDGASGWDTSNVENMSLMFRSVAAVPSFSPLDGWNITSLTNSDGMFEDVPVSVPRPTWYTE